MHRGETDNDGARLSEAMLEAIPALAAETDLAAGLARFADALLEPSSPLCGACIWAHAQASLAARPDHIAARNPAWAAFLNDASHPLPGQAAARHALTAGEPVMEQFPGPRHNPFLPARRCSVLSVPIALPGGAKAVMLLYADRRNCFTAPLRRTIAAGAAAAPAVLASGGGESRGRKHDAMTGLPNEMFFYECLDMLLVQSARKRWQVGLALLDLGNFRDFNERFGRREGDLLLCETAERLKRLLNKGEILARIGGNELAILIPAVSKLSGFENFLQDCIAAVGADYRVGERSLNPPLRIGASLCPLPPPNADVALRAAGQALDRARQAGGSQLRFQAPGAGEDRATRHEIIESINTALRDDRFTLFYQPQLDVRRNKPAVTGAEALIRMNGNGQLLRQPAEFIPVAENSSLICDIGVWVMNEALAQAVKWRRNGLDLSIGVNVGAGHLLHDDFVRQLRAALARHPEVPPAALEIEITESAALTDLQRASRVLGECREIGVGVAVDDFGTGHASLSYVQSLPITRIKLDQRFVHDLPTEPRNMAVITGAVTSSGLLGIEVIAEGVETILHGSTLIRLGCGQLQGYALTRPLDKTAFGAWIRSWQLPASWGAWAGSRANTSILPLLFAEISHRRHAAELLKPNVPARIEGLNECALTHWLADEQQQASEWLPALRQLHEAHVQFHRAVGMLRSARSSVDASRLQAEQEVFGEKTKALLTQLVRLQEQFCPRREA